MIIILQYCLFPLVYHRVALWFVDPTLRKEKTKGSWLVDLPIQLEQASVHRTGGYCIRAAHNMDVN